MILPTLYGKASTGAIKQWRVWTEGAVVFVEHGQVDGKLQLQESPPCEPKNVGRANETTPEQQAELEAQSKWNKQYDKDYRESVSDVPQSTLPNLAHKYQDKQEIISEALERCGYVDVGVKLDGVRCTVFCIDGELVFQTRGGKTYPVIPEIAEELVDWMYAEGEHNWVIDGELYCHGMHLEDITSAVKKHNKNTPKINFHIFDLIDLDDQSHKWAARYNRLVSYLMGHTYSRIDYVPVDNVSSHEEIKGFHDTYVDSGYEGVVVRIPDEVYTFGQRTTGMIKYKERKDAEYKTSHMTVDKNGCAVPHYHVTAIRDDVEVEETFKAPMIGTREMCQKMWTDYAANGNVLLPEWEYATIEFENLSKYNVPAKCKTKAFRNCNSEGNPEE